MRLLEQEVLRWRWPTFGLVYPIDLMLCVAVVGIACSIAIVTNHQQVFRAKFSDVLLAAGAMRVELVEQLALSGEPIDLPDVSAARAADSTSMDEHLAGRRGSDRRLSEQAPAAARKDGEAKGPRREAGKSPDEGGTGESSLISSKRIVDGTILLSGTIDGRAYEFAMYPAAADAEAPVLYVWICGRGTVPEGWSARPPASRGRLPDAYLPRECRKGGT